jgi:hypothetical protein
MGYSLGYFKSTSNFDNSGSSTNLSSGSSINRYQHEIIPEYQPSRFLNIGAKLHFDSSQINDSKGNSEAKNSFGDQVFFSEYRFFDAVGSSLGLAFLAKFPLYTNTTSASLNASGKQSTVLLGDAQSDYTVMATGEHWLHKSLRTRVDFGYSYRSDNYSAELPYMFAIAYVSYKLDLEFRLKGNLSLENDKLNPNDSSSKATKQVQNAHGGSKFALAENPVIHVFQVASEFWFNPLWSGEVSFALPYKGIEAPKYWETRFGITYRWVEKDQTIRRTLKGVDISTDQDKGKFEGEENDEFIE